MGTVRRGSYGTHRILLLYPRDIGRPKIDAV